MGDPSDQQKGFGSSKHLILSPGMVLVGAMEGGSTGVPVVCVCVVECEEGPTFPSYDMLQCVELRGQYTPNPTPPHSGTELSLSSQQRSRMVPGPGMAVPRVQARWSVRTGALWHQESQ